MSKVKFNLATGTILALSTICIALLAQRYLPNMLQDISANPIYKEIAQISTKAPKTESVQEKAGRASSAITSGDYNKAHQITAEILANSHVRSWDFYPFNKFMDNLLDLERISINLGHIHMN